MELTRKQRGGIPRGGIPAAAVPQTASPNEDLYDSQKLPEVVPVAVVALIAVAAAAAVVVVAAAHHWYHQDLVPFLELSKTLTASERFSPLPPAISLSCEPIKVQLVRVRARN